MDQHMKTIRKTIALALLALPLATACNTVEGVGKDLKKAGDHIEKRAEEAKPENHH